MKRRFLRSIGLSMFIALAMSSPIILGLALEFNQGSSGNIESLAVLSGPAFNRIFTCEWTDGRQALMTSNDGYRRLINLEGKKVKVEVGKTYKVKRGVQGKFAGGLPYLVES